MKAFITLLVVTLCLVSCNSSKKTVAVESQTPEIVTETVVTLPDPGIEAEEEDVDTPEEIENMESLPETEEITEPEIIDDSNQYEEVEKEMVMVPTSFDHSAFDQILSQHVTASGNVNYNAIKKNWSTLRNYIAALGEQLPTDAWSQEEKLAYWMNAYNAMTIDLILRHEPLESIKDIKDPWDQRFWKLGEKYYNLNEIEHKILRKMGDARIHFGINCASFSCPPLLNEAFTAQKVDSQLDKLARQFINDTRRNTITAERVEVSKIFTWFAKDFKTSGSLIDYLNQYAETKISAGARIRHKEYDWALND